MEKLRIVLCDDNKQELDGYTQICRKMCEDAEIAAEFKGYTDANEFLFDAGDDAFLALMSVLIVEPNGSFAAVPSTIRKEGFDGLIVYLSHSTEVQNFLQAFDASAYNYIIKGSDTKVLNRLRSVFLHALEAVKAMTRQYIVLSCAGEYRQIETKTICYFEGRQDHLVSIKFDGGDFTFASTLANLEERLNARGFVRTHRSYIVAIDAVHSIGTDENARNAISIVNTAINLVSNERAKLGALQNRLNHKISNLDTSTENLSAAESRIRDLDMAKEMTNYTRNNILVQASTAMLAQANMTPQSVLSLIG